TELSHAPHESGPCRRGLLEGGDSTDAQHLLGRLLRARRERPCRRAAEQRDERAALHPITSSAMARTDAGISKLSALAVLRLMSSSNRAGCSTGKSAGFAPLRILST